MTNPATVLTIQLRGLPPTQNVTLILSKEICLRVWLLFWVTDNISLASDYWDKIEVNQSVIKTLDWATQGLSYPYNSIFLSVPSTVLTTAIKEDSFELMESLNYLGSNLGLWPGLGLFQLFKGSVIIT